MSKPKLLTEIKSKAPNFSTFSATQSTVKLPITPTDK